MISPTVGQTRTVGQMIGRTNDGRTYDGRTNDSVPYMFTFMTFSNDIIVFI